MQKEKNDEVPLWEFKLKIKKKQSLNSQQRSGLSVSCRCSCGDPVVPLDLSPVQSVDLSKGDIFISFFPI